MIKHTFKTTPQADPRLKECPICGSTMLGRWKSAGWVFSCSNEDCILHRSKNNIRVPVAYNTRTKKTTTEQDAIDSINKRS